MYPKDRLPSSKAQHIPPNLMTLFAHVMSRATESSRGATSHRWEEVLQPVRGSVPGPFPMSAQDWRKAEAFSVQLQALIAARQDRCATNGNTRSLIVQNGGSSTCAAGIANLPCSSPLESNGPETSANTSSSSSGGKFFSHANGKVKLKGKPTTPHALHGASVGTATPAPETAVHQHGPRVTPREPSRVGEPSAPTKLVGRVAAARRVNGGAEGAIASLAGSRTGPGAFETPSHSNHMPSPGDITGVSSRGREHSPSRYPARLRSRRFPQLGGCGETPEVSQPRGVGQTCDADGDSDQTHGKRSPRHANSSLPRGHGRILSSEQHPDDWLDRGEGATVANDEGRERDSQGYGMRTRAVPKLPCISEPTAVAPAGTSTPQTSTVTAGAMGLDYSTMSAATGTSASALGTREEIARPRQVLQGGRSGSRAPVPRSSVGGRNYTDNHVKQLGLIEAAVVASATAEDHATYNLPRQGRTLTLTNVFKFVALRGASAMYNLATEKQVEAHTGRHSNFFDGKIDARIVGVIKKDIGDEGITKSRKFSKILLSLVAEGCTDPDCDWDHSSFTSESIAKIQTKIEAETGSSALQHFYDPTLVGVASAAAAATPSITPGPGAFGGTGPSGSPVNGAPSKRRLDLGRDEGQTPSPRMKKLKRAARSRFTGAESTPNAAGAVGSARSPPKEEDDMRAAEVLQGLKGIGGPSS